MLTTDQKGAVAELAIARAAAECGVGVYKPLTDGERSDLIFEVESQLYRVQCKYSRLYGDVVKGPLLLDATRESWLAETCVQIR